MTFEVRSPSLHQGRLPLSLLTAPCLLRSLRILELHHMAMIMDSQSLADGDSIVTIPPVLSRSTALIQILKEEDLKCAEQSKRSGR